jgi:hypothetical protein
VAGSLPHFSWLLTFARIFGVDGIGLLPMQAFGMHLVIYLTFVATIVTATVRAVRRDPHVVLTGLLAWSGVFGLGTASYFVGRSHPEVLIDLFSIWSLALVLLTLAIVQSLADSAPRRLGLPELAVLAGLGVALCSLAQVPTPWSQVARLNARPAEIDTDVQQERDTYRYLARATQPGAHVAIFVPNGHRYAYLLGIVDELPFSNGDVMLLISQWTDVLREFVRLDVHQVFIWYSRLVQEQANLLIADGFRFVRHDKRSDLVEMSR